MLELAIGQRFRLWHDDGRSIWEITSLNDDVVYLHRNGGRCRVDCVEFTRSNFEATIANGSTKIFPDRFEELCARNATVRAVLLSGGTAEDCAVHLAEQNARLIEHITKLEMIAPFKIRAPDGRTLIWRCSDEFIPEKNACSNVEMEEKQHAVSPPFGESLEDYLDRRSKIAGIDWESMASIDYRDRRSKILEKYGIES